YFAGARYFHFSGINPALSSSVHEAVIAAIDLAHSAGALVSFDPNLRLRLWSAETARRVLRELLPHCDLVLPGMDEAELLTGETDPVRAAQAIRALGARLVLVKLGAEGSLALGDAEVIRAPALRLERVVDPVGAGDGFAAGFLSGQLRGWDVAESLWLGNVVG